MMSQGEKEQGLLERAYLAFDRAGRNMHKPAPFPDAPHDAAKHIQQAIAYARENPVIDLDEAISKVNAGEAPPSLNNPILQIMSDIWGDMDEDAGIGGLKREPGAMTLVDRLREAGNPQTEKEITLARIHDVFDDLQIGGTIGLLMKDSMQGKVVYGEISPEDANKILDYPQAILQIAEIHKKAYDMQRRCTLLHLAEKGGFVPEIVGAYADKASTQYLADLGVPELIKNAATASKDARRKLNKQIRWVMAPTTFVGGVIGETILSHIFELSSPLSSVGGYVDGIICYLPGAVLFGAAAHLVLRNGKPARNLAAIRKPVLVINEYIQGGYKTALRPGSVRDAAVELRDVLNKIQPSIPG
ncbi:MAG: hypothetical protein KGI37_00685 [Alphaproteobacteria bacterium]|nr:hypothetical protein [Alphaproteobacteria bacterium]